MLGRYFARGLAGTTDPEKAQFWLEKAAANGLPQAGKDLAQLMETSSG
jgi:hypothetical protein